MRFEPVTIPKDTTVEACRQEECICLIMDQREYRFPLGIARIICDLLSITVYDESIVALMAKRKRLSMENEKLKEKLQNMYQYYRRIAQRSPTWKK